MIYPIRPQYQKWNRSSCFDAETLGALNIAIKAGVQHAIVLFEKTLGDMTEEERADVRAEVLPLIARGVSDAVMEFSETLKK